MLPKIKKILYAADLSPTAEYVTRYAVNSAKNHNAKLVVLHVLEEMPAEAQAMLGLYFESDVVKKNKEKKFSYAREKIQQQFQSIFEKEMHHDSDAKKIVETIELVEGYPADEILKKADQLDCDAIIMGAHSKGFLKHSYFGGTSKKVLRRVRKPVFIIPVPEGETDTTYDDK